MNTIKTPATFLAISILSLLSAPVATAEVKSVTVENFVRAETDHMFKNLE